MVQNKAFIFKKAFNGWLVAGQDLTVEDIGFDENAPPPEGGFTTKNVSPYHFTFEYTEILSDHPSSSMQHTIPASEVECAIPRSNPTLKRWKLANQSSQ
jgi:hypothetical protein